MHHKAVTVGKVESLQLNFRKKADENWFTSGWCCDAACTDRRRWAVRSCVSVGHTWFCQLPLGAIWGYSLENTGTHGEFSKVLSSVQKVDAASHQILSMFSCRLVLLGNLLPVRRHPSGGSRV